MFRKEYKYLIDPRQADLLERQLTFSLKPDPHAGPDGRYEVTSLYFDDAAGSGISASRSGQSRRSRYRIRMYDHVVTTQRLERRIRRGEWVAKETSPLGRNAIPGMEEESPLFRLDADDRVQLGFLIEAQTKRMGPALVVRYSRAAFFEPVTSFRMTIDRRVEAVAGCSGFYNGGIAHGCLPAGHAVLEIKTRGRIPAGVMPLVRPLLAERSAISKYMLGVETLAMRKEKIWVETSQYLMC